MSASSPTPKPIKIAAIALATVDGLFDANYARGKRLCEIALDQRWLEKQRHSDHAHPQRHRDLGALRVQPGDAREGGDHIRVDSHEAPALPRQTEHPVDQVGAFGEIRDRAAL